MVDTNGPEYPPEDVHTNRGLISWSTNRRTPTAGEVISRRGRGQLSTCAQADALSSTSDTSVTS
jgi:hypothetical protein